MTVSERVLEEFDIIASASGGPDQLRRLVLDLALCGQLVEQRTAEGTAEQLLHAVEAASSAETPVRRGRMSTHDDIPLPCEPPASWCVARLGSLLELINGKAFKPSDRTETGLPIIRIQNLNGHAAPFNRCASPVEQKFHIRDGDLLISWSGTPGTSFGAFIWNRGAALLNQHIFRAVLRAPVLTPEFTRIVVNARLETMIEQAHGGVGLRHITKGKLEAIALPIPPLAEQRRIVAKVEELMALCDDLEEKQQHRRTVRHRFQTSALDALANAESAEELAESWQRVRDNWDAVTEHSDCVPVLRQAVMHLATHGRLVPRTPRGESGHALLDRIIANAPPTSVRRGRRAKSDYVEPTQSLPDTWCWTALEQLIVDGPTNGLSPRGVEHETPVKVLTLSATTRGRFDSAAFKYADVIVPPESPLWLQPGDLLFQRSNSLDYVGISAIYDGPPSGFIYPDLMIRVRLTPLVDTRFVHLCVNATPGRDYFRTRASGTSSSMPKINQGTVLALPVPIPPLAEQRRIVTRVDELTSICDELERQLTHRDHIASRLAESVVHALTS